MVLASLNTSISVLTKKYYRFKRHLPCGGMQKRMVSHQSKGTENHPFGDGSTDSAILEKNSDDRASRSIFQNYVSQIFRVGAHGSMFKYSRAPKCPPSWSMDLAPRYSRIYNAVDRLTRKCFRWQPESFELFLIHQDVLDSHYLYCVRFHLIQTPELPAKNTHDQSYWTCRKIGGWDLDSVTSKVRQLPKDCPWTSIKREGRSGRSSRSQQILVLS